MWASEGEEKLIYVRNFNTVAFYSFILSSETTNVFFPYKIDQYCMNNVQN